MNKISVTIIILVIAFLAVAGCSMLFSIVDTLNKNYYKYANPFGDIEKKFTPPGAYDVSYIEFKSDNPTYAKYEIWYPSEMGENRVKYPLVIMANGTGIKASKYKEVFEHLASWGLIVVGNEDKNSRTGASSAATLDYLLELNNDITSIFYEKIDTTNIGIGGHSQGGVGAVNAVTSQYNGKMYKAIFLASTTSPALANPNVLGADWCYDMSKISIPCFMVAGTGFFDAGNAIDKSITEGQGISPLWALNENYNSISDSVDKVMARLSNKDHGDLLRGADAYMTAWFMYYLRGDIDAKKIFFVENAEILNNENWQDIRANKSKIQNNIQ